jgi:signal peptidase II
MKNFLKISGFVVMFLGLDQLTKYLAVMFFKDPFVIVDGFFKMQYVENTGIAFSLPLPYILILISNFVLLFLLATFAYKVVDLSALPAKICVSMILAGGIGNLIDRLIHHFVIDFISIWAYPFFNLADAFITIGVLLLILFYGRIRQVKTKTI